MQTLYWITFAVFAIILITGIIAIFGNAVDDDYENTDKTSSILDGLSISVLFFAIPSLLIKWSADRIEAFDFSVPWWAIIALFILSLIIGLLGSLKVVRNHFVHTRATLEHTANHIELIYERRFEQLSNLIQIARNHEASENAAIDRIFESQEKLQVAKSSDAKVEAINELDARSRTLITNIGHLPKLKSDKLYLEVMRSIDSLETDLIAAKAEYNDTVTKYNQALNASPNNLLAAALNFQKAELFKTQSTNVSRKLSDALS